MEDFPCNEAFEAAENLGFRESFSSPPSRVTLGLLVPAEAHHSNAVKCLMGPTGGFPRAESSTRMLGVNYVGGPPI